MERARELSLSCVLELHGNCADDTHDTAARARVDHMVIVLARCFLTDTLLFKQTPDLLASFQQLLRDKTLEASVTS
uniref:Centromere protein M n=1 Tax=Syphacia muris TaxID=451379 RepID=A0A0N5A979_9BILA